MILIQRYLVLILVSLSLWLYALVAALGASLELAVLASSVFTLVAAGILERRLPFRAHWNTNQGDLRTDVLSAGVLIGLIDPLLKVVAPLGVVAVYASLGTPPTLSHWPLWLQILLVLLVVEFGKYWAHRLHHQWAPLWWLHAMHHSSERMYVINGLRFHPLNYVINFALSAFPVMLLGATPEAILGYLSITQPVVLLQHANIDLRHGLLNKVFSTPEVHRWHHSTQPHQANNNFGNALLVWDHLFGTFKSADGFDEGQKVGLFASSRLSYPSARGYFWQLASMLSPSCCRR